MNARHHQLSPALSNRPGFALISALLAMILATALIAAIAFRASETTHSAHALTLRVAAFNAAESALTTALAATNASTLRTTPIGYSLPVLTPQLGTTLTAVRTDTTIAWLVATTELHRGDDVARHRIGMSVLIPRDTSQHHLTPVRERHWAELY